jgi:hypothetical protein
MAIRSRKGSSAVKPSGLVIPDRELLTLQYSLNVAARDRLRLVGRVLNCAMIFGSAFLPAVSIWRVSIVAYMVILFNLYWYFEDRRKSRALNAIEEIIIRTKAMDSSDRASDDYVRARYASSSTSISHFLQMEAIVWMAFTNCALAVDFVTLFKNLRP